MLQESWLGFEASRSHNHCLDNHSIFILLDSAVAACDDCTPYLLMEVPDCSFQNTVIPHLDRLLSSRAYPKTICPSEIARAVPSRELEALGLANWRDLMPEIRETLWNMRERGEVEILQKGVVLDKTQLQDIKGPIRARRTERDY